MTVTRVAVVTALVCGGSGLGVAQERPASLELVVRAGQSVRVALDRRVTVKHVGQPVTGTLVDPIYAYDRIVVPAGTAVRGRLAKIESASKTTRARAILAGDFTPVRHAVLQFDTIDVRDGEPIAISTMAQTGIANIKREVAGGFKKSPRSGRARDSIAQNGALSEDDDSGSESSGLKEKADSAVADVKGKVSGALSDLKETARHPVADAKARARTAIADVKARASDTLSTIKQPGRAERLKEAILNRLPYHPQFLATGTVYRAEFLSPLNFGSAPPTGLAPAGTVPPPDSVLTARLLTPLDSAKTARGSTVEAMLTEPVFSSDHELILPAGAKLTGEVTFARSAGYLRRNGQLRFLLERVDAPNRPSERLLASLYSVDASADDGLALDDEGGASVTNSKTRFIAPALAAVALRATADRGEHHHFDNDADDSASSTLSTTTVRSGGRGSRSLGGFFGFGIVGVGLSQISRPLGLGFGVVGVARTLYTSVFAKGREVSFPVDTAIQVRLAPGPSPAR